MVPLGPKLEPPDTTLGSLMLLVNPDVEYPLLPESGNENVPELTVDGCWLFEPVWYDETPWVGLKPLVLGPGVYDVDAEDPCVGVKPLEDCLVSTISCGDFLESSPPAVLSCDSFVEHRPLLKPNRRVKMLLDDDPAVAESCVSFPSDVPLLWSC